MPDIASASGNSCAFAANFFETLTPFHSNPVIGEISAAGDGERIDYCYEPDVDGPHPAFCMSEKFELLKQQMYARINALIAFCVRHEVIDAALISERLHLFLNRRFVQFYYDTRAAIIDSVGMRALGNFCAMIRDDRIRIDIRIAAIRNLSEGVIDCADGAVSNLMRADRDLAIAAGGIREKLWSTKEAIVLGVLQNAVQQYYFDPGHVDYQLYLGNEVHYVNAVWNSLADDFGLNRIIDLCAPVLREDNENELAFLSWCRKLVSNALTPDKVVRVIADECLQLFREKTVIDPERIYETADPAVLQKFRDALQDIGDQIGVDSEELRLGGFVRFFGDTLCDLRIDASLITLDLLRVIDGLGLLRDRSIQVDEWTDKDGMRTGLFVYGDNLAWTARTPLPAREHAGWILDQPGWSARLIAERLTVQDLLRMERVRGLPGLPDPLTWQPMRDTLREIIDVSPPAHLLQLPAEWLGDAEMVIRLLDRLRGNDASAYLRKHFSYFLEHFPVQERSPLIDRVMGLGNITSLLIGSWYRDPLAFMSEPCGPDGTPRLQKWMRENRVFEIEALGLALEDGTFGAIDPTCHPFKLCDALQGTGPAPILYEAMLQGNTSAITAWQLLLCTSQIRIRIEPYLPTLLAAFDVYGRSALVRAIACGKAEAVDSYRCLLRNPAVLPFIRSTLPVLLSNSYGFVSGLACALKAGKAAAIKAFHHLLSDPEINPCITHMLSSILVRADYHRQGDVSGLGAALYNRHTAAIREFHKLLADPVITPHIAMILPELVDTANYLGKDALSSAAKAPGKIHALRAVFALWTEPAIAPFIRAHLPKLLPGVSTDDGQLWLALALDACNAGAIDALHNLLIHPAVRSALKYVIPRLMGSANGFLDTATLRYAWKRSDEASRRAFEKLLTDESIQPYVPGVLLTMVKATQAPEKKLRESRKILGVPY